MHSSKYRIFTFVGASEKNSYNQADTHVFFLIVTQFKPNNISTREFIEKIVFSEKPSIPLKVKVKRTMIDSLITLCIKLKTY